MRAPAGGCQYDVAGCVAWRSDPITSQTLSPVITSPTPTDLAWDFASWFLLAGNEHRQHVWADGLLQLGHLHGAGTARPDQEVTLSICCKGRRRRPDDRASVVFPPQVAGFAIESGEAAVEHQAHRTTLSRLGLIQARFRNSGGRIPLCIGADGTFLSAIVLIVTKLLQAPSLSMAELHSRLGAIANQSQQHEHSSRAEAIHLIIRSNIGA